MKELTTLGCNYLHIVGETGKPEPHVELVFAVSEIEYAMTTDSITKVREMETIRFCVSAKGLKQVAEQLKDFADGSIEEAELFSNIEDSGRRSDSEGVR